jgi:hypothetical protein
MPTLHFVLVTRYSLLSTPMPHSSFPAPQAKAIPQKRNIKKVPFVELFNGRLQGVVSSSSDIERVYVPFFEAGSMDYYCSTNNNRPCSGISGGTCKCLHALLNEAIAQYGLDQVTYFLKLDSTSQSINSTYEILRCVGRLKKEPASQTFSRFLNYLRYLELPSSNQPLPGMTWFV